MITRQELCAYLDRFLQTDLYNDFCTNGLQIEGKPHIRKVATAVSASLATIQAAAALDVDALLVHHGIFWDRDPHPIVGVKKEKIALLLERDISLLAYHLPLDANQQVGNNWKAAHDLGWINLEPFGTFNKMLIGVKGNFSPMPREEFTKALENYYQHPVHQAPGGKEILSSAALISGGAYKSLSEAAFAGVDGFITGNFDEPAWNEAFEQRINFFALGHSATERVGPKALAQHLNECLGIEAHFIDQHNPF